MLPLTAADDGARCGGKAANLARLTRTGVPTAPGIVIPAAVLDGHLDRGGLASCAQLFATLLSQEAKIARGQAMAVQQRILETPLDAALAQALALHHASLAPGARVAVRSSALGEDSAGASFAGVFDTRLDVGSLPALETAVREVWASLFGERALAYARNRGAHPAGMAVVVQAQVDAAASGVLFTSDPRTGSDTLVVECCPGLGERLVSGEISPMRLAIDRTTGAARVEAEGDEPLVLESSAAEALVKAANVLERAFGAPQDIEWSIDRTGRLVVLQSRPITAGAATAPKIVWSNANIAENFPDPVSPFLYSFVARGYAAYFRGLGRAFGISRRRLDAMALALDQLVGSHAGRLYYNLTNIHTVLHLAPFGSWLAQSFNQFTGADRFPSPQRVNASLPERVAEALRIAVRVPWRYLRVGRSLARFEATVDAYAVDTAPGRLALATTGELADRLRGFLRIRLERWTDAALADTAAMVCYGALKGLLARWLPVRDQVALHNDLLKGLPGLASAVPVEKLWELSRTARAEERLRSLLLDTPAGEIVARLRSPEHAVFRTAFEDYLARWGFRYSGELMLTQPTPQEDPVPVIRLLQTYVRRDGDGPAEIGAAQASARIAATEEVERALTPLSLLRRLPLASRAAIVRVVLRATQGAIRLRERARMKQALLYTRLRHVALALGERLTAQGILERAEDIFFLAIDEAIALAEGQALLPGSARHSVAARRAELAAQTALAPPDTLVLPVGMQWSPAASLAGGAVVENSSRLKGSAACGGAAQGPAAVVLDVANADRVVSGQILVTRQTDPGWAAVFFLIEGLVIERGGMLSHGAIIAREYGIPAVVGVRDATRLIRDGDVIRVDGDLGTVERCGV